MNAPSARDESADLTDTRVRGLLDAITILDDARRESVKHASTTPWTILHRAQVHLDRELRDHFTGGRAAARSHSDRQD